MKVWTSPVIEMVMLDIKYSIDSIWECKEWLKLLSYIPMQQIFLFLFKVQSYTKTLEASRISTSN